MTNDKILQIIREEVRNQQTFLTEELIYEPRHISRNNQLIEIYGPNGNKELLTESALDTVQSVLDWAGFIPGIGDLIDAVNALIYFVRDKIFDGIFSLIAVIPVVGSVIAKPFKYAFSKIGAKLTKIFQGITKGGKGVGAAFLNLMATGGNTIRKILEPIYNVINKYTDNIATFFSKINLTSFNKTISDWSYGWFSLPSSFVKSGQWVIDGFKRFFADLGKPGAYELAKKGAESGIHSAISGDDRKTNYKKYVAQLGKKYKILRHGKENDWGKSRYALYKKDWHFICPTGVDGKNFNKPCGTSKTKEFVNGIIKLSDKSDARKALEDYMLKQKKT